MLQDRAIIAFVPTADAAKAKAFYEDVLGLKFISDDGFALVFDANGTMIRIARAEKFTPQGFTILGWQVTRIGEAVQNLSAKGVKFEIFEGLGQDPQGIWNAPGGSARVAWFKDTDGNLLSLSEHAKA